MLRISPLSLCVRLVFWAHAFNKTTKKKVFLVFRWTHQTYLRFPSFCFQQNFHFNCNILCFSWIYFDKQAKTISIYIHHFALGRNIVFREKEKKINNNLQQKRKMKKKKIIIKQNMCWQKWISRCVSFSIEYPNVNCMFQ